MLERRILNRTAKIAIIGLGYVGLPLAIDFCKAGFNTIGIDIDERRVESIKNHCSYILDVTSTDHATINKEAIDELVRRGAVRDGDLVIITKGDLMGVHGGTNAMKIIKVGEHEIEEQ